MTGFGSAASLLGRPDVGLLGSSEMVNNARRIVESVQVPVIADADTGYGNPVNVIRTVHEYERAGVAAINLEDQLAPKKCGHMEGKQLIPGEEMVAKVRAAVAARRTDLILIARTDARAVEGMLTGDRKDGLEAQASTWRGRRDRGHRSKPRAVPSALDSQ
jgi:2-methylisocitrate lyase-like PEP mutase family enzyme